jgi:hypothetical protein
MTSKPFYRMPTKLIAALVALATCAPILAHAQDYEVRVSRPGLKIAGTADETTQPPVPAPKPAYGALQAVTSFDFGSVAVGSSVQRTFTLANQGDVAATGVIAAVTGTGVSITQSTCGTANAPVTLAPQASCQLTATYAPTAAGALSGASVQTSGSFTNSGASQALTGSGYWNSVTFLDGALSSAWGATTLAATNTSLSADGLAWTVNARPAGQGTKWASYLSGAAVPGGRLYAEMSSTTTSAWLMVQTASSGTVYGVALDGPACQAGATVTSTCTPNTGNWANTRIGVLLDYNTSTITFYANGAVAATMTNVNMTEPFKLRAHDRDNPQNTASRTYRIYTAPNSWQYAPSNVLPMRK